MSYIPQKINTESNFTIGGNHRVSLRQTLFDGKVLGAENAYKWDTKGTGSSVFNDNKVDMAVTAGQYVIRQSKYFTPYFSGKPQQFEFTTINFHHEDGLIKRAGYFSSSSTAPYDSNKDGIWIEASDSTYKLVCSNNGVITHNIPWTSWDRYQDIQSYDWSKFTVMEVDFLWLGGAGVRLFLVIDGTHVLVHTIKDHAGYADRLIINNPQQPARYEIRSVTGAGSFCAVCCQITSEGGSHEQGQSISLQSLNLTLSGSSVGTNNLLIAVRKQALERNTHVFVDNISIGITSSTSDAGLVLLCLNPTYAAPLTWSNNSKIEQSNTNALVTDFGRIIQSFLIVSNSMTQITIGDALRTLGVNIDNTTTELALVYRPLTNSQTVSSTMNLIEY